MPQEFPPNFHEKTPVVSYALFQESTNFEDDVHNILIAAEQSDVAVVQNGTDVMFVVPASSTADEIRSMYEQYEQRSN